MKDCLEVSYVKCFYANLRVLIQDALISKPSDHADQCITEVTSINNTAGEAKTAKWVTDMSGISCKEESSFTKSICAALVNLVWRYGDQLVIAGLRRAEDLSTIRKCTSKEFNPA